jgi:hypothetical protein
VDCEVVRSLESVDGDLEPGKMNTFLGMLFLILQIQHFVIYYTAVM